MEKWVKDNDVLNIVKDHLTGKISPQGGIYIGKRPKGIRLDVVTIGLLTAVIVDEGLVGVININTHHEEIERIEELTVIIINIMDMAYIDDYFFKFDKQYYFKLSQTLNMSNVRIEFIKAN